MKSTVFLSGSRNISRLNPIICDRLKKMIDKRLCLVIGDANGADKAVQKYLANAQYDDVVVFCAGDVCRNNVGAWRVNNVYADPALKGRDFYEQKDKAMASAADFGFVLWDGKSPGSINNVLELVKARKAVVVYFEPEKSFQNLKKPSDILALLRQCDESDYRDLNKKIHFDRRLADMKISSQGSLGL